MSAARSWRGESEVGEVSSRASLSEDEFRTMASFLRDLTGIHMADHKRPMMESRLQKRMRARALASFSEYLALLARDSSELDEFVNALTTNKTEFFREGEHFDYLASEVMPELYRVSPRRAVKVWCAAASTGEEPYSLAITMSESALPGDAQGFRVLATDIDTQVLRVAEAGVYSEEAIARVPDAWRARHFLRGRGANLGYYRVRPELQQFVKFRRFNLVRDALAVPVEFDAIFLRNVLIYFQPETIQGIVARLVRHLRPGGFLFIGHSETLNRIDHDLKPVASAIYRKGGRL